MNEITDTLSGRIRRCAEMAGSGDQLARLTGIPRRTLEYYMTGEREPRASKCVDISLAVGVNPGWLVSGIGLEKLSDAPSMQALKNVSGFAFVPLYDAEVSTGHDWQEGARELSKVAFSYNSLIEQGLDPKFLSAVRIMGESMHPLLSDGDTVLVDHSKTTIIDGGIYVLRFDSHLYAKRLQYQFDGSLHIISENKAHQPMSVPKNRLAELEVIGKVVWCGGWV